MPNLTQAKVLVQSRTTPGRDYFNLPDVPSIVALFVDVVSGTAAINIEITDDNPKFDPNPTYIPVQQVTETSLVIISIPVAVIATNVITIAGEIHVSYRMTVGTNYLATPIYIFNNSTLQGSPLSVTGTLTTSTPGSTTRLYGPAFPGTSAATIYTVPLGSTVRVTSFNMVNTTGAAATITISLGLDSPSKRILSAKSIAANDTLQLNTDIVMNSGEFLQAFQGTANAISLTINGAVL